MKISDAALTKIRSILRENEQKYLVVKIEGGGCSGFQYAFDTATDRLDCEICVDGVFITWDQDSNHFLSDASIDWTEVIGSSMLVLQVPLAQSTCGCGASFSV